MMDDCLQFADDGGAALSESLANKTALHSLRKKVLYIAPLCQWKKRAPAMQTWAELQSEFIAEYLDLREHHRLTAEGAEYGSANCATATTTTPQPEDITMALDQLALVATTDSNIIAQLINTNARITKVNQQLVEQLRAQSGQTGRGGGHQSVPNSGHTPGPIPPPNHE